MEASGIDPRARDPESSALEALRFARTQLGPACERYLGDPANQVLVLSRMRHGYDVEDAVLAEVHRSAAGNRAVADEFVAYFLSDLMRLGHRLRSPVLKRFLDTGDLVQSVMRELWPEVLSLRFETRGRFLSYLARRLRWKASDRTRALEAASHREDLRVEEDPEELAPEAQDSGPELLAIEVEERERLTLLLVRLPVRDRQLLTLFLKGAALTEIAKELGLSNDAARMVLVRAVRRARRLV